MNAAAGEKAMLSKPRISPPSQTGSLEESPYEQ